MRILIAPDKFKGSLTAREVAAHIATGIRRVLPQAHLIEVPMADGGEGTVQSLVDATGGEIVGVTVTGPLGEPVEAFFGILGDGKTAVIEMASASGLVLVPPEKRNPMITTTRGTGELLLAAAARGCSKAIVGIGGSATNDGGAGLAQAVGIRLLDADGQELPPGGAALARLHAVDVSGLNPDVANMEIVVASDVTNPLCGPNGASAVYGPQKGATPQMVVELDAALEHYADVIHRQLGKDVRDLPGAGAAGGLGAGLLAFLPARMQRGVDIVLDVVELDKHVRTVDLVITGEGGIDSQTAFGKAPAGVAEVAVKYKKPVIALAGSVADDARQLHDHGFDAIFSLVRRPMTLEEAMDNAAALLETAAEQIMRLLLVGARLNQ
ncbi:MAG: glycerate kinase [Firmicutes bacterium]|jgi:glycerate kinase|nr:glycerate kinase [Bacillota bacterium]